MGGGFFGHGEVGDDLSPGPQKSFMGVSQQRQRAVGQRIELTQIQFMHGESAMDSENRKEGRKEGQMHAGDDAWIKGKMAGRRDEKEGRKRYSSPYCIHQNSSFHTFISHLNLF